MTSSRAPVFVPEPIRHLITAANGGYSGQPRRVIVDDIDSSSVTVTDPTSYFSCCFLKDAFQDLEIGATSGQSFDGRVVGGIARYGVSYLVLDFSTHKDALIAVRQLGSYNPKSRLLAQFSDSNDRTFSGRMASGLLPASQSVHELQALPNLANDCVKTELAVLLAISTLIIYSSLRSGDPTHKDNTSTGSSLELVLSVAASALGFQFEGHFSQSRTFIVITPPEPVTSRIFSSHSSLKPGLSFFNLANIDNHLSDIRDLDHCLSAS